MDTHPHDFVEHDERIADLHVLSAVQCHAEHLPGRKEETSGGGGSHAAGFRSCCTAWHTLRPSWIYCSLFCDMNGCPTATQYQPARFDTFL